MDEEMDLAGAGRRLDLVGAVDEVAGARFHAEAIERGLPQRMLDALAEIRRNVHVTGLEGALEGGLEPALGVGGVELGAGDADPRTAAGRTGADVGRHLAVRGESEPDQLLARRRPSREDAGALRNAFASASSGGRSRRADGIRYLIIAPRPQPRPPRWQAWPAPRPRTNARGRP